jgi:ABC-type multidrug transport system fused ATPase/permease subunit
MSSSASSKSNSLVVRILGFVKPFFGLLFLSFFLNIIFSMLNALSVALIKPVFQILFGSDDTQTSESIIPPNDFLTNLKESFYDGFMNLITVSGDTNATLLRFSIFLIFLFVLKNVVKYFAVVASSKLEEGVVKSIRDKIFSHLLGLSVDFFSRQKQGNLMSIITNDVTTLNQTTVLSSTIIIREFTQVIIFLIVLLATSVQLTLIAFSTSVASLILIKYANKFLRRYAGRMQTAMADYTTTMQETIGGIKIVKAYNAMFVEKSRFEDNSTKYLKSAVKNKKVITMIPAVNEIFAIVALCVVLFVGGVKVLSNQMSPDDLMLFLFTLFAIMAPIRAVVNNMSKYQRGFVAAERIFTILDESPKVKTGFKKINKFEDCIELQNIEFSYYEHNVINDISFKINKHSKVALVGPSGSGKSTVLDLLIRFYDPNEGNILIDGQNIKNLNINDYRGLYGIVSQETVLFNDTIANNIRYGLKDITDEQINEAARQANAYDFIQNLPDGMQTIVGDRGASLSGGERQRVAIARALLRNPEILIFDEATSALDAESEKVVQGTIDENLHNKTAIIVAHRLATIINCDIIYVFDNGKIIESGNHKELIQQNGLYKKLYDIQFADNL